MTSKYAETGVDVHKKGIGVFKPLIKNLFPHAFAVVYKDPNYKGYGLILHSDGQGSKAVQCYLHYKVTGDERAFEYSADDFIGMNIGDVFCVNGEVIGLADYVAINRFVVPKDVFLKAFSRGIERNLKTLAKYGINIPFAGGETADLPDQVRTVDVSGTVVARVKLPDKLTDWFYRSFFPTNYKSAITGEEIKPGDIIIGLRSDGRAVWEDVKNSGHMSNGSTLSRHCLMLSDYEEKYPEIRDPKGKPYTGKFRTDQYLSDLGMTVGEALISPTRQFAIPLNEILKKYRKYVHGAVHNTGGGQTKCLRIGKNLHFIKDNLPDPPPFFYLVQQESGESWEAMHEGFNMGIGIDIIVPREMGNYIMEVAKSLGVGARETGYIKENSTGGNDNGNRLTIKSKFGTFEYPEPEKKE